MAKPPPQSTDPSPGSSPQDERQPGSPERRSFLVQSLTAAAALVAGVVPLTIGLFAILAGLGKKSEAARIRVASLAAIPADGTPRAFPVSAERTDAWTRHPTSRIGTVFIRKAADEKLEVFNATCPHLGCIVGYKPDRHAFACPCHNSFFDVDGARIDPEHCPSPRGLDTLAHEVVDGEIYVTFQRYRSGIPEKIPE